MSTKISTVIEINTIHLEELNLLKHVFKKRFTQLVGQQKVRSAAK